MHPVQAAPRQRTRLPKITGGQHDAPRAGSAEAKAPVNMLTARDLAGCTPCRQRRGKALCGCLIRIREADAPRAGSAEAKVFDLDMPEIKPGCTPCRQRRGKVAVMQHAPHGQRMHPVQAAPRQRHEHSPRYHQRPGCTPCRQRRGKVVQVVAQHGLVPMHPVQAAPRQRMKALFCSMPCLAMHPVQAAPRQSPYVPDLRYDGDGCTPCRQRRGKERCLEHVISISNDAPRAGSAEAKVHSVNCSSSVSDAPRAGSAEAKLLISVIPSSPLPMHPVQAAPRQSR